MTAGVASRDGAIDLLRVLLVGYVVAYLHLGAYVGNGETHVLWWTVAVTAVVLGTFTFLSGYVLGRWHGDLNLGSIRQFYVRRLLRIYPLYLVALAAFVLLWLADPVTALKAAFGISMFWPEPPMTLWFITMILVCYLLAPAFVAPPLKHAIPLAMAIWCSMLLLHVLLHPIDLRMLTYFPAFVAGVMCRRLNWRGRLRRRQGTLLVAFLAGMALSIALLDRPALWAIGAIPSVVAGSLLLMVVADARWSHLGLSPAIVLLSYISFSVYLFHRVVFELLKRHLWPNSALAQWMVLLILGLPLVLLLCGMAQRAHDRLMDRLVTGRGAAAPGS
jgi:peptidoglycan/LPS O-acetylase OafA/YrhL